MLPTINLIYNRKRNRKVEACIYCNGKRRYLATGVSVPTNATYRNGVVAGCTSAPSLNKTLMSVISSLQQQLQVQIERGAYDLSAFSLTLKHNNGSFYDWAVEQCQNCSIKDSSKGETLKVLCRWRDEGIELFSDITLEKIRKAMRSFEARLRPTTVRLYATHLNKYISMACAEKIISENPLNRIRLPKGKARAVCYLTQEELEQVERAEVSGTMEMARDVFLFACYTGLAYSDLMKIKKEDIVYVQGKAHIIDRRKKTGGQYRIRILPKAMNILAKYNYNLNIIKNNTANINLTRLEKKIGLTKHLSMHVGRHTFATLALSAGVRIETVSRMLAHADITTTQIYAKVLQKDVDEGFDILENM